MKKVSFLFISALAIVSLAACGSNRHSSSSPVSIVSSELGSSIVESSLTESSSSVIDSSSSENNVDLFSLALSQDYSNMTLAYEQSYAEGYEYGVEYYYNDYKIVYDGEVTDGDGRPYYLYYHDYKGESYLYFEADKTNEKAKSGWLNKGYRDADLSMSIAYFDMDVMLNNLTRDMVKPISGYPNYFYMDSPKIIDEVQKTFFQFAWFNNPEYIQFAVDDDGYLRNILALDDVNNEDIYVFITLSEFGSTNFTGTLPPEPNDENTIEYWEYKGYDGPIVDKFATEIAIEIASEVTSADDADAVLEIDESFNLKYTLSPADYNVTPIVTWHSTNEDVVTLDYSYEERCHTVSGNKAGTTEVYAQIENDDGSVYQSNRISVKVNPLQAQNKEGCIYDFTFIGVNNGSVNVYNEVVNDKPYTVTSTPDKGKVYVNNGSNSYGAFEDSERVLLLSPNSPSSNEFYTVPSEITFDFGTQQVSSLSFYYAMFFEHMNNLYTLEYLKIQTSNDGSTWNEIDITEEVKNNISPIHKKLMEKEFDPASKVKISAKGNFIGKNVSFGFSSIAFMANDLCNDFSSSTTIDVEMVNLVIENDIDTLYVGQSAQLSAMVLPSNASDKTVTYHSSNEEVAAVSSTGVVTALSAGSVEIYAVAGGVSSNVISLTINDLPSLNASMLAAWKGLDINDDVVTISFTANTATVTYHSNTYSLTYSSYIASNLVSSTYHVFSDGTNTLEARYNSYAEQVVVNISFGEHQASFVNLDRYVSATAINLSAETTELIVGKRGVQLSASYVPANATGLGVKELTWDSSDDSIATVTEYGYVSPVSVGSVTITATNEDGVVGSITFTVRNPIAVTGISLDSDSLSLEVGQTHQIVASVIPADADDYSFSYESSNTAVARVSSTGLVTAVKVGSATITVTTNNGISTTLSVTVTASTAALDYAFVGEWTGEDSLNGSITTLIITASGEATLENDYGDSFTFTLDSFEGSTATFVNDNGDTLVCYMSPSYMFVTLNDGEYLETTYCQYEDAPFEK